MSAAPPARPAPGRPGRDRLTRGKTPAVILTIGVDVGGTKAAAGVVDDEGHIVQKLKRSTPAASPVPTAQVIAEIVTELAPQHEVSAVGLGAAGFIDETRSTVLFAPNLAWRNEPLRQSVEDRVGLPVIVENDADSGLRAAAATRHPPASPRAGGGGAGEPAVGGRGPRGEARGWRRPVSPPAAALR